MGFDIRVSDASLRQSPLARCGVLRQTVFSFVGPDSKSITGLSRSRTLNSDVQYFHFVNHLEPLPYEPTDEQWAYSYGSLPAGVVTTTSGETSVHTTIHEQFEFFGFLSRAEFFRRSQEPDVLGIEYAWPALAYEQRPDAINYTGDRQGQICATCPVKDLLWSSCMPRLMGAGDIDGFLKGLTQLVQFIATGKRYTAALQSITQLLNLADRVDLEQRFNRTFGFYNRAMTQLNPGEMIIAGPTTPITLEQDVMLKRLVAALLLHDEDEPYTSAGLADVLPPLRRLLDATHELLSDSSDQELAQLLPFSQQFETLVRALQMAHLHNLEVSVSY